MTFFIHYFIGHICIIFLPVQIMNKEGCVRHKCNFRLKTSFEMSLFLSYIIMGFIVEVLFEPEYV